ncbi:MAG: SulP family inorganic anion transporter [Burkholderiaceae bacterium]|jgi:MFS superfamily sulfate permease-like transporter|nr:SulP family inorganic anion transporter [Burkholderiaceae bacterium]
MSHSSEQASRFRFLLNFLNWPDLLAGISIAGLLLPQALAYSSIGNLSAQAGIIALFAGLLCYGLVGSSRFALVSPTSSSAVVLAASSAALAGNNTGMRLALAGGLVIAAGIVFLLAAATRMGGITDFIARPVLRGFTFGLGIVIIIKQTAMVAGLPSLDGSLFSVIADMSIKFRYWNYAGIGMAAITIALLFIFARIRYLPGGISVILLGIVSSMVIDLPSLGIPLVGTINISMADLNIPVFSPQEWIRIFELSLAMALILYAESYGSIRSFAMKYGDVISPNRDLLALGLSNLASGLFQGMPVGAGYSATAANEAYGAKTRMSGIFAMLITMVVLITALPYIERIPQPVLGGIVIYTMLIILKPSSFDIYFVWKNDRLIAVISVLAVLLLGVMHGLLAAIAISIMMMLKQISASTISELGRLGQSHDFVSMAAFPEARPVSGVLILRPDQGIFFANAERIFLQARQILAALNEPVHTVILSLELTNDLDTTSVEALRDFFAFMEKLGITLILARLKDPVYGILQFSLGKEFPDVSMSRLSVERAVRLARVRKRP